MVGDFRATNARRNAEVLITIGKDGRARTKINGDRFDGYINDRRLYVGDAIFEIERTDRGFNTVQVGHWGNRVSYERH
jgi:hypothetical protein